MEEILASIRRIIEDSDTAKQPTQAAVTEPAPEAIEPEPASARTGSVIEVESFRADLRASAQAHEPRLVEPEAPETLAELHQEVRAASLSSPAAAKPEPVAADDEQSRMSAVEEALVGFADEGGIDQDEMMAELTQQLGALQPLEPEERRPAEPKANILSEEAGRQVAAAFGELTEAFSANRRRSFEEIAEEMMRPMLQDWLDNNLPVLVERLVREEIERVARGAGN